MDTILSEVLVFKLFRAETAERTVTTPAIVITLDIIKNRRPHYFPAGKVSYVETFNLQRVEETFRKRIVITATFCAQFHDFKDSVNLGLIYLLISFANPLYKALNDVVSKKIVQEHWQLF